MYGVLGIATAIKRKGVKAPLLHSLPPHFGLSARLTSLHHKVCEDNKLQWQCWKSFTLINDS
jgi:hypothetical protein